MSAPEHVYVAFSPLLTTDQVAAMTGLTNEWYCRARKSGLGPPFMQLTRRIVRYDRDTVLAWWREHTKTQS
jgi:predicted DNA-binding transcriptional regulator AlpA